MSSFCHRDEEINSSELQPCPKPWVSHVSHIRQSMYHSNREDPSNHRCVLYDSRSPGHFSAAAVISPSEKRQAENLTPLHHQSFHFTNDAAAQLATRSMEPCYTRPNDIVRAQQLSINLPWPAGAESAAKPHDHRNNKEHGIARICRGECTPAPY